MKLLICVGLFLLALGVNLWFTRKDKGPLGDVIAGLIAVAFVIIFSVLFAGCAGLKKTATAIDITERRRIASNTVTFTLGTVPPSLTVSDKVEYREPPASSVKPLALTVK